MRDMYRRPRGVLPALVLSGLLSACGGGGGGGGGGVPPGNQVPTAAVIAPVAGVTGIVGDTFPFVFTSNDDDAATVRILADGDGNIATTPDQTVLYQGVDANGAQQSVTLTVPPALVPAAYTLLLSVDDGVHAPLVITLPRPLVVHLAIAGVAPPRINRYGVTGGFVVFSRGEAEDNTGPLNGDGLSDDGVMVLYDAGTRTFIQPLPSVSMDVTAVPGNHALPVDGKNGTLAWLTLEADQNFNINAGNGQNLIPPLGGPDLDLADRFVSYVTPALNTTPITNTYGGVASILGMEGSLILVRLLEAGEGVGGTVINADIDTADAFFGYVDPAAALPPFEFNQLVLHSGFPGPAVGAAFRNAGVVNAGWLANEIGGPFLFDANLDLDQGDTFLVLGTLQQPGGLGAPALFVGPAGVQAAPPKGPSAVDPTAGFDVTLDGRAGYYIAEGSHNVAPGFGAGNDRNGDGLIGMVPAFYNTLTATETIPPGTAGPVNAAPGSPLVYDGTRMFFTGTEAPRIDPAAGTNNDGDGGGDLQLLYWSDHSVGVPVATPLVVNLGAGVTLTGLALDLGGSMVKLAPGWAAVIVNELANGNQDINGSGFVDFAYLLLETGSLPAPTVHNPHLVPSTAGNWPLSGIWGQDPILVEQGVVLRVMEQQNGDLDNDGNATEILTAYVAFNTPTMPRIFDAGGDYCAVANGRIAVTADEAYTGRDYDGNGLSTDTVFRVLDFRGAALEPGRLCSRRSVPVTEDGSVWAYLRDEAIEGRNLNGDGDTTDRVLGLWIP